MPSMTERALYWSARPAIAPAQSLLLETRTLTTNEPHASLAPVPPASSYCCAQILFEQIGPEVNILAAMGVARDVLIPEHGVLKIHFSEAHHIPRLPAWRDYWCSIAERLGFEIQQNEFDHMILVRSASEPRWLLKLANESDIEAIKGLFKHVFQSDMSDALWDWKYGNGRGNAVLAYREGVLVAHYGGMYREISLNGESAWALQAGDVMVHPAERGVFTRHGAFFLMTTTWLEMYGALNFGFPNRRSMQLGEKLGIYLEANHLIEARWQATPLSRRPIGLRIDRLSGDDAKLSPSINRLWSAMCADLPAATICVRDWAWIEHRYLRHATHSYAVYAVKSRWSARILGILVIRHHAEDCELMDVIAPMDRLPMLINEARRLCALAGKHSIYAWVSDAYAPRFNHALPSFTDLDISIPGDAWTQTEQAKQMVGTWWLTSGDTDFR